MSRSKKLGDFVRTSRLTQGMTQTELAEKAGTSRNSVSRVERDALDASFSTLRKIVESGLGGELELGIKL